MDPDRVKVVISSSVDPYTGELVDPPPDEVLYEQMLAAGWTDDPGQGKAVLLPDGREVHSPIPMRTSIDVFNEPTMMERLSQMLEARLAQLRGDAVLDESLEESLDFDIADPEDYHPRSIYEIQLVDEAPALPKANAAPEVATPTPVGDSPPA